MPWQTGQTLGSKSPGAGSSLFDVVYSMGWYHSGSGGSRHKAKNQT